MNRIFLAVTSIICTHFVMKVYDKVTQDPPTKEEIYRKMRAEWELRKRAEHDAIQAHLMQNHIMSVTTPLDGSRLMNSIGTVEQMRDALRHSPDQADAMAMAMGSY